MGRERSPGFSNTVQCHTDLVTCCDDDQEVPRGDWFTPGSDTRLGIWTQGDIYQSRKRQVVHLVHLRRRNHMNNFIAPTGIYLCVIATMHDVTW